MSDCIITDVPANAGLTDAQKAAAIGKVLVEDTANQVYVVGGDATTAAGNERGAGYCIGLDQTKTRWTIVVHGVVDEVTITGGIDISADGNVLSFDTDGTILKQAAGENACGSLPELADVAAGGPARVFFDFRR